MEVRRSIFYSGLWPRVVVEVNRWFKRALVPVTSPKEEGKVTLQFRIYRHVRKCLLQWNHYLQS